MANCAQSIEPSSVASKSAALMTTARPFNP